MFLFLFLITCAGFVVYLKSAMSKLSSIYGGESSSAAHKRNGEESRDEEGPFPSECSSLGQGSSSSIPKMPLNLIADLILPFVTDRATWNSVCSASKELCLAGKNMTPPWPNKAFNLGRAVRHVAFSPSGLQLAFGVYTVHYDSYERVIHVWNVWGKETLLAGHTGHIYCQEYSSDGEYLASGSQDGSIRIWHSGSFLATSFKNSRERSTPKPQKAGSILLGSDFCRRLSFSRTNSNLLASGGLYGEIKVWNVQEEACVHSFNPGGGIIRSLFFAGGTDNACIAVAGAGSIIRLWRAEGSSDFASATIGEAAGVGGCTPPAMSSCGSFLATSTGSSKENTSTLALYNLETMTKTQSVFIPDFSTACFALSPDSKQLAVGNAMGSIRVVQADDFSIQRVLKAIRGSPSNPVLSLAFDPSGRVLACGYFDGTVELRAL
jgi:WD40 repeat protein